MAKLPKYTLAHNDSRDRWELKRDKTHNFVKAFDTKPRPPLAEHWRVRLVGMAAR